MRLTTTSFYRLEAHLIARAQIKFYGLIIGIGIDKGLCNEMPYIFVDTTRTLPCHVKGTKRLTIYLSTGE